ncbi:MAG: electron transfer flavoprotein subunit alpha/FixB family protein [Rhodothermaceae bacterium]|nr:electron transfer flavoprotein subunit alpha/FixB family protein [Rhodothermaceae bacterium]
MILIISDIQEGKLRSVNAEVYTAAVALGKETGQPVATVLLGASGLKELAATAGNYGVEKAIVVEDAGLAPFSPDAYAAAIAHVIRETGASVVLMGATFTGKDVMPRVAQHLDVALVQDVINVRDEGGLVFTRPMYAGKVHADVRVQTSPALATIRPKSYKPAEQAADVAVEPMSVSVPAAKVQVVAYEGSSNGKLDVTEADIIVSGGRGMQGADKWGMLEELADLLGAATGCSRPVSDDGWRPHEEHIGQTGKTVSPDLYIACGISGAIQHVAGVSSSKFIVAVNKDPEAPIFKVADYGIVGDVFDVVPVITEEIRKVKG